ncbi:hypothetical protein CWO92_16270 [Heyndrickxia camelliae]|uniref:Uncharacterized protein n=1 Tax=Heyndrickxia camelliae TaxID=1707093 RepID=A0A2N3LHM0_9BACI|nr:hypothetical protein CWO92_16270 [Heyndrickxia camelliae]
MVLLFSCSRRSEMSVFFLAKNQKGSDTISQPKQQERSPPIIIFERQSDENWQEYSLFCLIALLPV